MANYLTTLRGTLGAGTFSEIFQHSLAVISNAEPSVIGQALVTAWNSAMNSAGAGMVQVYPNSVTYTDSTVALISGLTDGKVNAAWHTPFGPGVTGGNASGTVPAQTAVAISLTAGFRANGAPLKGRFYLPAPAMDQYNDTNGLLLNTTQGAILVAIERFLDSLIAGGHSPAVWSRTEGRLETVDSVRVGDRADTIRRRRNAGAEVYQIAQITP